jgi:hypothetical protein
MKTALIYIFSILSLVATAKGSKTTKVENTVNYLNVVIEDANSNETVPFADVVVTDLIGNKSYCRTNENGIANFKFNQATVVTLNINSLGFEQTEGKAFKTSNNPKHTVKAEVKYNLVETPKAAKKSNFTKAPY